MSFDVGLLKMDGDDDGSGQVVTVEENLPSAHIDDDDDDINDDDDDDGGGAGGLPVLFSKLVICFIAQFGGR